MFNSLL